MNEIRARVAESSHTVVLTAAGIFTAIMLERLVGRMSELSDGQVIWDSTASVLVQSTLILASITAWWVFYATLTTVGRWVLRASDLLAQVSVGALGLLMIENLSQKVTTEFLALNTIVYLGGAILNRVTVAGIREQDLPTVELFKHYS